MAPTAATAAPSSTAGRRARPGGGSPRLAADDWIQAALDVMEEEGIGGVKVPRLCARLGVTKGSFYWHFADFDTFLGAVARRWADEGERLPGVLEAETSGDTEALLLHAMRVFAEPRNRNLARAMRDWAQHDERAREAIRRADEELFARLTEAMVRCGFDEDEAELRAKILYYSGVGYAHVGDLGHRASAEGQLRKTWQLLTRP